MTPEKISQILTHITQFSFVFAEKFPEFKLYRVQVHTEVQAVWKKSHFGEEISLEFSGGPNLDFSFYGENYHTGSIAISEPNSKVAQLLKEFQQKDKE